MACPSENACHVLLAENNDESFKHSVEKNEALDVCLRYRSIIPPSALTSYECCLFCRRESCADSSKKEACFSDENILNVCNLLELSSHLTGFHANFPIAWRELSFCREFLQYVSGMCGFSLAFRSLHAEPFLVRHSEET